MKLASLFLSMCLITGFAHAAGSNPEESCKEMILKAQENHLQLHTSNALELKSRDYGSGYVPTKYWKPFVHQIDNFYIKALFPTQPTGETNFVFYGASANDGTTAYSISTFDPPITGLGAASTFSAILNSANIPPVRFIKAHAFETSKANYCDIYFCDESNGLYTAMRLIITKRNYYQLMVTAFNELPDNVHFFFESFKETSNPQ